MRRHEAWVHHEEDRAVEAWDLLLVEVAAGEEEERTR